MRYAVIIVNWNGAADTIACLDSFLAGSPDAIAIVIDNGSSDDSLTQISVALASRGLPFDRLVGASPSALPGVRVWLAPQADNLGFAGGCNVGLRLAAEASIAVCVFLNNDTIVEPAALDRLVGRLGEGNCFACLPMLTLHGSDRIWNCGGVVCTAGFRRYHLAGRPRDEGVALGEIRCSFFTGCCFAVRTDDFMRRAGFSERFFFGEEDFELALWMKDRGLSAVCLTTAVVQHKVSASFNRATRRESAKVFVYYLNRFIHMRLRLGRARWAIWVAIYLPYTIALMLRKRLVRIDDMPTFIRRLLGRALVMDRVTRSDFESLMQGPN